jgi:hypothetical protein
MTQQILYVAIGPRYLAMALRSAAGAQAGGFAGSVVIVTDQVPPSPPPAGITFAAVPTPADPHFGPLEYKTRFLDFAIDPQGGCPDQVLFLDADTLVAGDVTPAFAAAGVAMTRVPSNLVDPVGIQAWPDYAATVAAGIADPAAFWNSGAVVIANDAAGKALVAAWHAEWAVHSQLDELAMLRALRSQGVTPAALDPRYNDMAYPGGKTGVIRHYVGGQKLTTEFLDA